MAFRKPASAYQGGMSLSRLSRNLTLRLPTCRGTCLGMTVGSVTALGCFVEALGDSCHYTAEMTHLHCLVNLQKLAKLLCQNINFKLTFVKSLKYCHRQ